MTEQENFAPVSGNIEKLMAKVAKLLDMAEDPKCNPEEAKAMRERADALMTKYAIDEAELERTFGVSQRQTPEKINIVMCAATSHVKLQLAQLAMGVAEHFRVRVIFSENLQAKVKYGNVLVIAMGYPSDLKFFALMFGRLHLHLAGELEPTPDPGKSKSENVYVLHESGMSWRRITHLMHPEIPEWGDPEIHKAANRLKTVYRSYCAENGIKPRVIQSPVTYQRNVVLAYSCRIADRLYELRVRRDQVTAGTALELRLSVVDEFVNKIFPEIKKEKYKDIAFDAAGARAGREAGDSANLSTADGVPTTKKAAIKG